MKQPYIPFGPEWEKEMMKCSKKELVEMLRDVFLLLNWRSDEAEEEREC